MCLTDSQKLTVSAWIAEGKSIADVQRLLRDECSLAMTYLDVRFLVDDLDIVLAEPESKDADADADAEDADAKVEEPEIIEEGAGRAVTIDVDAIICPGTLISGQVTFSDGVSLPWQLSGAGQIRLVRDNNEEYRPSSEDLQDFQIQLQDVLQKKGY